MFFYSFFKIKSFGDNFFVQGQKKLDLELTSRFMLAANA